MKLKYKFTAIFLLLTCIMTFQGCSFAGMSDDDLLQPPRATGVKAEIQNLLETATKGDYKLKYPQSGDYRSAIIMHDIGGDDEEEAIAFYKTSKDNSAVNIMFMKEVNDKWEVISSYSNANSDIDRIYFGDVDNDGSSEVIVAWSSYLTSNNQIIMYDYSNNEIQQIMVSSSNTTYTEMTLTDITNDNIDDLIVFTTYVDEKLSQTNTSAILYSNCVDGTFSKVSEISTASNVVSYSQIITGNINNEKKALFIDGYTQNQNEQLTQIIYYSEDEQILRNPLNLIGSNGENQNITLRNTVTVCKDVDNDGITEFPSAYTQIVNTQQDISSSPIIKWHKLDISNDDIQDVVHTFSNYFDGYYFILPKEWENQVVVSNDNASRTTLFYEINNTTYSSNEVTETPTENTVESATIPEISSEPQAQREIVTVDTEPLLTLRVFTEKVWKNEGAEKLAEGYIVLKNQSGLVYTFKQGIENKDKMNISTKQVNESFNIIK